MNEETFPRTGLTGEVAPHEFRAVRGCPEDEEWASTAWLALVMRGQVSAVAAERALGEVLDLVRATGDGPADLYGPPEEWAQERLQEWAAQGSDVIRDEPARWRDLPEIAAITATGVTLLMLLVCALEAEWTVDWTLAWVLLPFLGSGAMLAAVTTWEHVVSRHSLAVGIAAAGGVVLGAAGALAGLFALTDAHPLAHASLLWHVPLAAAYAALAWLLGRLVPDAEPNPTSRAARLPDEAWTRELARILRTRGDTTETQVRRLVEEARAHAESTGASLAQEFGSPAAYAAQVSPRPLVRARRSVAYHLGMLALWLWVGGDLLFDGSTSTLMRVIAWLAVVCLGLAAAQACWRYARHARSLSTR